jgi:homogentisate 1,2-dioxygenase
VARSGNRRTWLYRAIPSACHTPFQKIDNGLLHKGSFDALEANPNQMRWEPNDLNSIEGKKIDFTQGTTRE